MAAATITLATMAGSSPSFIAPAITSPRMRRCCAQAGSGVSACTMFVSNGVLVTAGWTRQHPDAVFADLVVQGLGVALDCFDAA